MSAHHSKIAAELAKVDALWNTRARKHGAHSVINLTRSPDELESLTTRQTIILLNNLTPLLTGKERYALDFGCGIGRFSADLAKAINGNVIAYDPCSALTDLGRAQPHPGVLFPPSVPAEVFFSNAVATFDVIWVVNVLGGIPSTALPWIADNLTKLLTPNGLLFLAEHTHEEREGLGFWKFYHEGFYPALFPEIALLPVGGYTDVGNKVTIFAGRKFK